MSDKKYVIVICKSPVLSPIRHIVEIKDVYNEEEFKKWYYKDYRELEGDEFIYCRNPKIMQETVQKIKRDWENGV